MDGFKLWSNKVKQKKKKAQVQHPVPSPLNYEFIL